MAKKGKTTGISNLLFEDVDPYGAVIGDPVSKPIERFPLDTIRPDPEQPRRLLPQDLADLVNQGDTAPVDTMREWVKRADVGIDTSMTREMRELRRLAASIAQHGLINPITIRPTEVGENRYIIVTGERRYWAHVLLSYEGQQIHEGDKVVAADQIRATLIPHGASIRAHQIVENLMREDINVLEKAHGLWALRHELSNDAYRRHSGGKSVSKAKMVPWKQVEEALDMSRQYRARIVAILDLNEDAQRLIDQHNLAEATIRPIVEKLKKYPDLQLQALRELISWQEADLRDEGHGRRIVPSVRILVEKLLTAREAPPTRHPRPPGLDFGKFRQKVSGTLRYIQKLDESARTDFSRIFENDAGADVVDELQALRDQIDWILASIPEDIDRS
ncbi:MAG: ParB N-terminal domain-containing protein [Chloroflexi bacterium]|nr:ParB N-terminal domain-containing protein [Chloroflexota bacterium]